MYSSNTSWELSKKKDRILGPSLFPSSKAVMRIIKKDSTKEKILKYSLSLAILPWNRLDPKIVLFEVSWPLTFEENNRYIVLAFELLAFLSPLFFL